MTGNSNESGEEIGLTEADKARIKRYLCKPSYERTEDDLQPSDDV